MFGIYGCVCVCAPPSPQFLPTETKKTDSTYLLKLGQAGKLGSDKRPDLCSLLACKKKHFKKIKKYIYCVIILWRVLLMYNLFHLGPIKWQSQAKIIHSGYSFTPQAKNLLHILK